MSKERYVGRRVEKKRGFWPDYGYLLVTAAVVFLLFRVIFQLAWVPSGSMETAIPTKSLLLSLRLPYLVSDPVLERGDVVTFQSDELGKLLVKRVIGLPGEEVSFSNGYVYVNGQKLEEPYLNLRGITNTAENEVFRVPEGCYFMMGDNRNPSADSRKWKNTFLKREDIIAKVLFRYSPNFTWYSGVKYE